MNPFEFVVWAQENVNTLPAAAKFFGILLAGTLASLTAALPFQWVQSWLKGRRKSRDIAEIAGRQRDLERHNTYREFRHCAEALLDKIRYKSIWDEKFGEIRQRYSAVRDIARDTAVPNAARKVLDVLEQINDELASEPLLAQFYSCMEGFEKAYHEELGLAFSQVSV